VKATRFALPAGAAHRRPDGDRFAAPRRDIADIAATYSQTGGTGAGRAGGDPGGDPVRPVMASRPGRAGRRNQEPDRPRPRDRRRAPPGGNPPCPPAARSHPVRSEPGRGPPSARSAAGTRARPAATAAPSGAAGPTTAAAPIKVASVGDVLRHRRAERRPRRQGECRPGSPPSTSRAAWPATRSTMVVADDGRRPRPPRQPGPAAGGTAERDRLRVQRRAARRGRPASTT